MSSSLSTSESVVAIGKSLSLAQGKIEPAPKDAANPYFKSKYADLASVWRACRDALAENGIAVIQSPTVDDGGWLAITTRLLHESGEWIEGTLRIMHATADDVTPQKIGSGITYARRYSLAAMVGVVAEEDDDGNAASQPRREPQRRAANGNPSREQKPPVNAAYEGFRNTLWERLKGTIGPGKVWESAAEFQVWAVDRSTKFKTWGEVEACTNAVELSRLRDMIISETERRVNPDQHISEAAELFGGAPGPQPNAYEG